MFWYFRKSKTRGQSVSMARGPEIISSSLQKRISRFFKVKKNYQGTPELFNILGEKTKAPPTFFKLL